jgi:uncharacterized membrane protein
VFPADGRQESIVSNTGVVLALLGAVLGGAFGVTSGFAGAIAGAALGFAIGANLRMRERLENLEHIVDRLQRGELDRPLPERKPEPRAAPIYEKERAPRFPVPSPSPVHSAERPAPAQPRTPAPTPAPAAARAQPLFPRDMGSPDRESRDEEEFPSVVGAIRDWFLGGNLVVRVGVIVLFIGVGFLLKFAADRNVLPIELRLTGAAMGGITLLIIGWRLRSRLRAYALALQGGGVGLLYLTTFAALRFYELLPAGATFALLVAVAVLSAFLAVRQNALVLAMLGALGGFLAPILTSTGQGDHVVLFGYYALLDVAIVGIAWFRSWRPLNLLAFVFTYGIGTMWGVLRYAPENFATTEPFVVLYLLIFLAVSVLFALRTAPRLTDYVDGTLVFGTPVVTMLLQSALVRDWPYAMSFSALALGALYLSLAKAIWTRAHLRLLAESFLALGVAFLTLSVPLALDGHWTAGAWALEGAAILWVGLRQQRLLAVGSGVFLQFAAAVAYVVGDDVAPAIVPLANSELAGAGLIALGGFITARVAHTHEEAVPGEFAGLGTGAFYWALGWMTFAALNDVFEFVPERHWVATLLAVATLTTLGCAALSHWNDWRVARGPTWLLLPAMAVLAVVDLSERGHWLAGAGAFAWPLALGAWIGLLRWREHRTQFPGEAALHVATLWLGVAAATLELAWQIRALDLADDVWHRIVHGVVPAFALLTLLAPAVRTRWPVSAGGGAYLRVGAFGLAAWLWTWAMVMNFDDAGAASGSYLPILNPVEIAQLAAFGAVARWVAGLSGEAREEWMPDDLRSALAVAQVAAIFALLNAMLLRFIHHSTGIPYALDALMGSTLVQASLSIFWGAIALGAMVLGTRLARRALWFAGAWLLAIVLVKMFLVDLSSTGTVARIVSFIGVGVLMLVIGRFSPVPPAVEPDPASAGR